jgi:hypothetical protein
MKKAINNVRKFGGSALYKMALMVCCSCYYTSHYT